ncbi:MAG: formylmethanofuran dehydrogenase subunit C [Nitrososphaerota archaeon]|jgi:formylmethanofuran dehydrogenase subunit C|nr:formylmethanofuran dehydrogenase subunit C [Nitrososphaerota archaeon]
MITLTALRSFSVPVQAPCITPENFAGKSITEIKALPVTEGNCNVTLGDLFKLEQTPEETPNITLNGDLGKVKRVGQAMKSGEIVINGNIGMHTGEKMAGGKIVITGNAGGWTGSEMKKGTIEIHGDGGDYLASPYRGNDLGMKGGLITVDGNVGSDVGCHLKGGIIKIKGSAGRFLGYHMNDGVIYVEKDCDVRTGACMVGGKIVVGGTLEILPSFTIDSIKPKVKVDNITSVTGPFYVFLGDLSEHGTGKLFVNKSANSALKFYEKYL